MALKKCRECGETISAKAAACPHCGAKRRSGPSRAFLVIAGSLLTVTLVIFCFGPDADYRETVASRPAAPPPSWPLDGTDCELLAAEAPSLWRGFTAGQVNARTGPSTSFDVYSTIEPRETVNVIQECDGWAQARVLADGETTWNENLRAMGAKERAEMITFWVRADLLTNVTAHAKAHGEPQVSRLERRVESHLKQVAADPDAVDVMECSEPWVANRGWGTRCTFRGRNAFGGMVVDSRSFVVSYGPRGDFVWATE